MVLGIFNIGPLEFLIMAAAAIMLFGGDLPQTARKAARTLGRLRAMASELGREFSASDELPSRKDLDLDLRRLADPDDRPRPARPELPGRREDEPVPATPADDGPDELPAWRRDLRSELPEDERATDDEPTGAPDTDTDASVTPPDEEPPRRDPREGHDAPSGERPTER